jgi:hypothetical protein
MHAAHTGKLENHIGGQLIAYSDRRFFVET